MPIKKSFAFLCLSYFILCGAVAQTNVKFIPDDVSYQAFIYGNYDPKKMSVLVFKDPFCPYCIRAINKIDRLSAYNVFIFWAPILGENSRTRVASFFKCEKLADTLLLSAVKNRDLPNCKGKFNQQLMEKNMAVVENYHINAVPSYFLQGQATSLQALIALKPYNPRINGVRLDWSRYVAMQRSTRDNANNLVLIVPEDKNHLIDALLDKYSPQYVFVSAKFVAAKPSWFDCKTLASKCMNEGLKEYEKKRSEFDLLLGHLYDNSRITVVDFNGTLTAL
jgi:hypothetical protein